MMTLAVPIAPACAQPDFFRGKTITMLIGYTSGGGYDLYARVLSRLCLKTPPSHHEH